MVKQYNAILCKLKLICIIGHDGYYSIPTITMLVHLPTAVPLQYSNDNLEPLVIPDYDPNDAMGHASAPLLPPPSPNSAMMTVDHISISDGNS